MQQPPPQPEDEERYFGLTPSQINSGVLGGLGLIVAGVCAWLFLLGGLDTVTGEKDVDQSGLVAQHAANGAILKLSDLPEGWKATVQGNSGPEIDFEFSEACKFLEVDYEVSEIASAQSDELYGPAQQTLGSEVSVFRADTTAADAFSLFTNWATCREETKAAFTKLVQDSFREDGVDPATVQTTVAFEPVQAPALGDATGSMYRLYVSMQLADQKFDFTMDILAMQRGRMLGTLVYTAFNAPPDTAEQQQLAQLAAAKLIAAEASLDA
jgi:hypothetical protein